MAKFDDKVNGNTVNADEYNNLVRAPKNAIEDSGQVIDASNTQLSEAIANYVGSGSYYTDSGAADAYVLNTVGSFKGPTAYQDGMIVRFRAGNASATASTVNVNALGVKNIKLEDGATDITTQITTNKDTFLRYDLSGDVFQLLELVAASASTTASGKALLPKQITISNGTDTDHDIDCTAGNFQFDDGSGQAVTTALTKQIDATWVAGDNQGGLDTGTVAADTTYHVFAIYDSTNAVADYIFSLSPTSPTLPGTYDKQKRIASLVTDGSANILPGIYNFNSDGSYEFNYDVFILDVNAAANTTTASTPAISVPTGISVKALINIGVNSNVSTRYYGLITSPLITDSTPSSSLHNIRHYQNGGSDIAENPTPKQIWTNTSAQVRTRFNNTNGDNTIFTEGWFDKVL